jgi:hypothetical protein
MRPYPINNAEEIMIVRRSKFLTIVQTAMSNREFQFVRQACLIWMASYPGDLLVNFIYATALVELGDNDMAIATLERLIRFDPEFTEALALFARLKNHNNIDIETALSYLTRNIVPDKSLSPWLSALNQARAEFEAGEYSAAEKSVLESLAHNPNLPLPAIMHLHVVLQMSNATLLKTLSELYSSRWKDCLQIKIFSALADMSNDNDSAGVEKLHWAAAHDVSGQVVHRLLGPNHVYQPLWPEDLKVYLDLPVPANVAAELGWNILATGSSGAQSATAHSTTSAQVLSDAPTQAVSTKDMSAEEAIKALLSEQATVPLRPGKLFDILQEDPNIAADYSEIPTASFFKEDIATLPVDGNFKTQNFDESIFNQETRQTVAALDEIQSDFDQVTRKINRPELSNADTRFPSYVFMTSRNNLNKKYGENTSQVIIDSIRNLSAKILELPGWNSTVFIPDDPENANELGTTLLETSNAETLKRALIDLDSKLSVKGEMIGALLIVGGNDIVPFHLLPNPTDDSDPNVPSDNPYATLDDNYFVQQWPVGRLPDEKGKDAGYLLEQLRFLNNEYSIKKKTKKSFVSNFLATLFSALFNWLRMFSTKPQNANHLGVSAEVWKTASSGVFGVIDDAKRLLTSPPTTNKNILENRKANGKFGYFNLHGLKESNEWYGQRDLSREGTDIEYPVALNTKTFTETTGAPSIVLSEACFGAWVLDKKVNESVALNFLSRGTRAFVGSTVIAYGAPGKTLVAADLLAHHFWTHVKNEVAVGYALMRAKLALASKMTADQGFLDGEDQKTILSFVIYGDPLASSKDIREMTKPIVRVATSPVIKTISDSRPDMIIKQDEMPNEILDKVRKVIKSYVPGMEEGKMAISPLLGVMQSNADPELDRKNTLEAIQQSQRYVVTVKKSYEYRSKNFDQFARMTFDQKGKMVKLSTSK